MVSAARGQLKAGCSLAQRSATPWPTFIITAQNTSQARAAARKRMGLFILGLGAFTTQPVTLRAASSFGTSCKSRAPQVRLCGTNDFRNLLTFRKSAGKDR